MISDSHHVWSEIEKGVICKKSNFINRKSQHSRIFILYNVWCHCIMTHQQCFFYYQVCKIIWLTFEKYHLNGHKNDSSNDWLIALFIVRKLIDSYFHNQFILNHFSRKNTNNFSIPHCQMCCSSLSYLTVNWISRFEVACWIVFCRDKITLLTALLL